MAGFYGGYVLPRVLIGMILSGVGMAILVRGPGIEGVSWVWSEGRASFLAVMVSWVAIFVLLRIYPTGILALNPLAYLLGVFVLFFLSVYFVGRLARSFHLFSGEGNASLYFVDLHFHPINMFSID
ncbi:hypothetical protein AKJ41_03625 [candidate division MSBL1 archaeon SCGC-AAA259O05]|uniref:Uncharacterized protein n=1 Tax=candidate division MSBL1 archaeon SCGC-AAA259O05 TaxID=1698271 RepID=A0A133V311_9EURY|nr:hypothetical protein AKJ41_03625 [candidate division MSBL1 archaeon SCGC-AAA259O05]